MTSRRLLTTVALPAAIALTACSSTVDGTGSTGGPVSPGDSSATQGSTSSGLAGTSWALSSIVHNEGNTGSGSAGSDYKMYRLAFDNAGGFAVVLPCGPEGGKAGVDGGSVSFTDIKGSRGGCGRDTDVADGFDAVLVSGTSWSIQGDMLKLTNGSTELDFNRA